MVVQFEHVSKKFGSSLVLNDVSFSFSQGEVVSLLGPNGAGKSTALQILLGLRRPTLGHVHIFGALAGSAEARQKVGVTPQDLQFPGVMSIREILDFLSKFYQMPRPVPELMKHLELTTIQDRKAGVLSGGERRRLGLAAALIGNPQLLVLDEPTTGLDLDSKKILWSTLKDEVQKGMTLLLTSHDLQEIQAMTDRVLVLSKGQVLFEGTLAQIHHRVNLQCVRFDLGADFEFKNIPPTHEFHREGNEVRIQTQEGWAWVQYLVQQKVPVLDLQVSDAGLEEALDALLKKERP
jgi:ABC-2 type transport system ATP-binding protein